MNDLDTYQFKEPGEPEALRRGLLRIGHGKIC
jgi:hypothetical protein